MKRGGRIKRHGHITLAVQEVEQPVVHCFHFDLVLYVLHHNMFSNSYEFRPAVFHDSLKASAHLVQHHAADRKLVIIAYTDLMNRPRHYILVTLIFANL